MLDEKCVSGIEPNEEMLERHAEANLAPPPRSTRTSATTGRREIVKEAAASGRPLREVAKEMGVDEKILDEALDHRKMARPHD